MRPITEAKRAGSEISQMSPYQYSLYFWVGKFNKTKKIKKIYYKSSILEHLTDSTVTSPNKELHTE